MDVASPLASGTSVYGKAPSRPLAARIKTVTEKQALVTLFVLADLQPPWFVL
jgi:hypothetical protein